MSEVKNADAEGRVQPIVSGRPINCDQVAWMTAAIGRYIAPGKHPAVSRETDMKVYGLLYEIMEVANLYFEDEAARHNGTPVDARFPMSDTANSLKRWPL